MNLLRLRDPVRYGKVYAMLAKGATIREAATRCGIAPETTRRLRKEIVAMFKRHGKTILCACGKPAGHSGWCRHRFLRSPRRQMTLALMQARQRAKKL